MGERVRDEPLAQDLRDDREPEEHEPARGAAGKHRLRARASANGSRITAVIVVLQAMSRAVDAFASRARLIASM